MSYVRFVLLIGITVGLLLSYGYAQQNKNSAAGAKKEHTFRGKIEKIDVNAKTFTVNGQKVEGWMEAMTMVYVPDKEGQQSRPSQEVMPTTVRVNQRDFIGSAYGDTNPPGVGEAPKAEFRRQGRHCGIAAMQNS